MTILLISIYFCYFQSIISFSPYNIQSDITYYIEANREGIWPSCSYRFLSYTDSCTGPDLWKAAGKNQEWTLENAGNGLYYLKTSCGSYLSYPSDCNQKIVDLWPAAGVNQAFRLIVGDNQQFEYYLEATGRSQCQYRYLSFPVSCTTNSPDKVDLWSETGVDQRFRLHPVRMKQPINMNLISDNGCADPYVWYSLPEQTYALQCTAGKLPLSYSSTIHPSTVYFKTQGESLGGTIPSWATDNARWAPENVYVPEYNENYCFFSDSSTQSNGVHRMGWSLSKNGEKPNQWTTYSSTYMNLGNTAGGEIDGTVFVDDDKKTYLIWKSDDNNAGSKTTRIWLQQIKLGNATVQQLTSPIVILDSTGLWWVDSWVDSGSLVEGPEIVKTNGWYYLFFASGKYCQDSYAEGVARSHNINGPYEKMKVPFLSTGIVGNSQNKKIIGPGHASFVQDKDTSLWYSIFHGSLDYTCNRLPFASGISFGYSGWPVAEF